LFGLVLAPRVALGNTTCKYFGLRTLKSGSWSFSFFDVEIQTLANLFSKKDPIRALAGASSSTHASQFQKFASSLWLWGRRNEENGINHPIQPLMRGTNLPPPQPTSLFLVDDKRSKISDLTIPSVFFFFFFDISLCLSWNRILELPLGKIKP
jgi:hypothetical protein